MLQISVKSGVFGIAELPLTERQENNFSSIIIAAAT